MTGISSIQRILKLFRFSEGINLLRNHLQPFLNPQPPRTSFLQAGMHDMVVGLGRKQGNFNPSDIPSLGKRLFQFLKSGEMFFLFYQQMQENGPDIQLFLIPE